MRVVIDSKIPYIKGVIERFVDEAVYVEGKDISQETVRSADALIVRTRTRCDRNLLAGSRVRFIATATIGFDHIDTAYCREAGIEWHNAPGCNAASVEQYVTSALLLMERDRGLRLREACIGVVGVGHVGTLVAEAARQLGMTVLCCDPPREEAGDKSFTSMAELAERCDVITFHTPLTRSGAHPTFHLADEAFFGTLRRRPFLINTSRGEVVDNRALLAALRQGTVADAAVDVWENEPDIDRDLLQRVMIGTPHIAGYSADGKANATRIALDAFCRFFHIDAHYTITPPLPQQTVFHVENRDEAQLLSYNPYTDSEALKAHPEQFEYLRGHYPLRRELKAYSWGL